MSLWLLIQTDEVTFLGRKAAGGNRENHTELFIFPWGEGIQKELFVTLRLKLFGTRWEVLGKCG